MKKFILIVFAVSALAAQSNAQGVTMKAANGFLIDTVTNTGTKVWTGAKVGGPQQTVTVSSLFTAITGTFKGVAYLYGSPDNVTFYRVRSTQLQGAQVDSLLIDAAHPKYSWVVEKSPFIFYQVSATGVGTVTFSGKAQYVAH